MGVEQLAEILFERTVVGGGVVDLTPAGRGGDQFLAPTEVTVEGALGDPGASGDLLHGDGLDAPLDEELVGREDRGSVRCFASGTGHRSAIVSKWVRGSGWPVPNSGERHR